MLVTGKIYFSLVIACYNENPIFDQSMPRILSVLKSLHQPFEIILVEDKSQDQTPELVKKFCEKNPSCRAIFHPKNRGRGQSVMDGIATAAGKYCGFIDVDLEVSEKFIPPALGLLEKGCDVVIGKRRPENTPFFRTFLHYTYVRFCNLLLGLPFEDVNAGFKFFRTSRIKSLLPYLNEHHWFWDTEVVLKAHLAGFSIHELPVVYRKNPVKKSTVRVLSDSYHFLSKVISYSRRMKSIEAEIGSHKPLL